MAPTPEITKSLRAYVTLIWLTVSDVGVCREGCNVAHHTRRMDLGEGEPDLLFEGGHLVGEEGIEVRSLRHPCVSCSEGEGGGVKGWGGSLLCEGIPVRSVEPWLVWQGLLVSRLRPEGWRLPGAVLILLQSRLLVGGADNRFSGL